MTWDQSQGQGQGGQPEREEGVRGVEGGAVQEGGEQEEQEAQGAGHRPAEPPVEAQLPTWGMLWFGILWYGPFL